MTRKMKRRPLAEAMKATAHKPSDVAGRQIAWLRERKGWRQVDLAERIGEDFGISIDPATVARIETGNRGLSLDELFLFAAALDAPPALLMLPLGTGDDVSVTPTISIHPWLAYMWMTGEGPLTESSQRARRLGDQYDTKRPLLLYRRLQELQERAHDADLGSRHAKHVGDDERLRRERERFAEAIHDLAEHLLMMDAAGVRPPRLADNWYAVMDELGLDYPEED
jgi:transcriptional regulator with XRE-family HTH domain